MTTYYKAVRPGGESFYDPSVKWAVGETVTHPDSGAMRPCDASTYLSVSVSPADCTGFSWPCRLFRVEPVGGVIYADSSLPNKRCAKAWRVVEELDATLALGPQGVHVAALIERAGQLTATEVDRLNEARYTARYAARDATWHAAWNAARDATRYAARDAAWDAVGDAVGYATLALIVRDLISTEHYDTLTMPWRQGVGRLHPDDEDVAV